MRFLRGVKRRDERCEVKLHFLVNAVQRDGLAFRAHRPPSPLHSSPRGGAALGLEPRALLKRLGWRKDRKLYELGRRVGERLHSIATGLVRDAQALGHARAGGRCVRRRGRARSPLKSSTRSRRRRPSAPAARPSPRTRRWSRCSRTSTTARRPSRRAVGQRRGRARARRNHAVGAPALVPVLSRARRRGAALGGGAALLCLCRHAGPSRL